MEAEKRNRISAEGMVNNPKKSILHMIAFVSITYIVIKINGLLDTIWIADLGSKAVSAVSTVTPIYSTVAALGIGLGTGACVCIAYNLGAGNRDAANRIAGTAIYLSLIVAIPVILFLLFGVDKIYSDLKGTEVGDDIAAYLLPMAIGSPILILSAVMGNFLKAEGAMKAVSFCTLMSIPVNIVLTPILVFVLDWGIIGASTATVAGSCVTLFLIIWVYKNYNMHLMPRLCLPTIPHIKEVLGTGLPRTVEEFSGGLVFMIQSAIVISDIGTEALAIHGLAFAIPYLLTVVSDSISAATQPVASAALGAGNDHVMRVSMSFSAAIVIVLGAIATVILFMFPEQVLTIYSGGDLSDIKEELIVVTRMYALFLLLYLLQRFCSNMMQVLRKAHVWAIVYLILTSGQVAAMFFFATDYYSMAIVVTVSTSLIGVVATAMLYYYTHKVDNGKIKAMLEAEKGVLSY